MLGKIVSCTPLYAVAVAMVLAGCASEPKPATPGPLDEPVDAFEAVGAPQRAGGALQSDSDQLSSDIQRLQNARETYKQAQQRQAAETNQRQAKCRQQTDSHKVAIQDGSGDPDATYCEPGHTDTDTDTDKGQ